MLSNTLPNIISVPLNMNESRTVLAARIADIAAAMGDVTLPTLPDKTAWLASRGLPPELPTDSSRKSACARSVASK